jgi:DNA-binding IclR family transcriptional regulator
MPDPYVPVPIEPNILNAAADPERLALLVALEEHPDLTPEDLAGRVGLTRDRTREQLGNLGAAGLVVNFGDAYAADGSGWIELSAMLERMSRASAPRPL